ncbi:MAG: RIP metalloprotease RseP [Bacteroidetes bacterium]|nr:RIP metalloprotease RseP [Bacteroidota bacterium]
MPPIVIQIFLFILSLSLLIVLHEFGHYITAKWFKVRVLKFYLFFDFLFPLPEVMKFSLLKKKVGDTEYGIGWFPLGGYVQMAGIMDESMDKEALKEPVKDYEFRAKPAWQRLIILLGGVIVNVLLAFVIYGFVIFHWGEKSFPVENMTHGLHVSEQAKSIGLENGDIITYVEDEKVLEAGEETYMMLVKKAEEITVERNGETIKLPIEGAFYGNLIKDLRTTSFVSPAQLPIVDTLLPGGTFGEAGAQKGDRIISVDGSPVGYFQDIPPLLQCKADQTIDITVLRGNDTIPLDVKVGEGDKIGFGPRFDFEIETVKYGFGQSMVKGVQKSMEKLDMYIDQFALMFDKDIKGYKQIGGFGAIGGLFPKTVDWEAFWNLTAFLSIMLAFLNLLPIPALDGGHALFTIYEMIFRRPPNEKFMAAAQMVGMGILLVLVVFANGNDLFRAFSGSGVDPCG